MVNMIAGPDLLEYNNNILNNESITWIHDHLPYPKSNYSLTLTEQKNYLESFDGALTNGQFFILDHYVGQCPTSKSILYFPLFLYSEANSYRDYFENLKLDFSKKKVAISCCNNKPRPHRFVASCWLANKSSQWEFLHTQDWHHDDFLDDLDELLQLGNIIDWTHSFGPIVKMLPRSWIGSLSGSRMYSETIAYKNCENFSKHIKTIMDQSVFNLVLESGSWEKPNVLTEKYLNCVYGGNIPITFGYGSYDILENMGMDSFKDILNTSSQYEPNLVTRTWRLLSDNADLFDNANNLIQDPKIQQRLQHNLDVVKDYHNWLVKTTVNCNHPESLGNFLKIQNQIEKQLKWKDEWRCKKHHYKLLVNGIIDTVNTRVKTG